MNTDRDPSNAALGVLLKGLSGRNLIVQPCQPAAQSLVSRRAILTLQSLFAAQERFSHASVAHAAAHLLFSQPARKVEGLKPMGVAVVSMIEDARVERLLIRQYPGTRRWFAQAMQAQCEEPSSEFALLLARVARVLLNDHLEDDHYWVSKARRLFLANEQVNGLHDYAGFRALASILANDLGQMRVQFNAQQYLVPVTYRDDNSYLWDFATEAASEDVSIESPQTATVQQTVHQQHPDRITPQHTSHVCYLYPEWDARTELVRQDWCTVLDYAVPSVPIHSGQQRSRPSRRVTGITPVYARSLGRERLFRQREGDALDMSAVIDSMVDRRRGADSDGRHYMRRSLRIRKSSMLLLLDLSASVTDRIPGSAFSILDIEKQAAILIAGMALEVDDRIAIHGFSSDTRTGVHYYRFLDFGQVLTQDVQQQLEGVEGKFSTRMGAAIRHARGFFKGEVSDQHVMIVMTDGAPSDIDVFDPNYLVSDTARAVKETTEAEVYGLVMDADASNYAKKIFGVNRYRMILRAEKLAHHLLSVYSQLRALAH